MGVDLGLASRELEDREAVVGVAGELSPDGRIEDEARIEATEVRNAGDEGRVEGADLLHRQVGRRLGRAEGLIGAATHRHREAASEIAEQLR